MNYKNSIKPKKGKTNIQPKKVVNGRSTGPNGKEKNSENFNIKSNIYSNEHTQQRRNILVCRMLLNIQRLPFSLISSCFLLTSFLFYWLRYVFRMIFVRLQ